MAITRTTVRAERSDSYLTDPRMSLKAKGLLSLVLQIRKEVQVSEIAAMCEEEEEELHKVFCELIRLGYIDLSHSETKAGEIERELVVYDTPFMIHR